MVVIVSYLSGGKLASRKEIQAALNLQKSYTSESIATMKKKGYYCLREEAEQLNIIWQQITH